MVNRNWLLVGSLLVVGCSSSPVPSSTSAATTSAAAGGAGTTSTTTGGGAGGATTTATGHGGSGSGGADAGGIPAGGVEACTQSWSKICKELFGCAPVWVQTVFVDEAACDKTMGEACAEAIYGPNKATVAQEQACAASFTMSDCSALWRYYEGALLSPACHMEGTAIVGAPCSNALECQSGFCNIKPGDACGKCVARVPEGKPCNTTTKPCEAGIACAGVCKKFGDIGVACDAQNPCHQDLSCLDKKCSTSLPDGSACDPLSQGRECELYHFCNTKTKECAPLVLGAAGTACGILPDGAIAACKVGSGCRIDDLATYAGTCVATLPTGGACTTKDTYLWGQGPCAYPESCIQGTCQGWGGYHCN